MGEEKVPGRQGLARMRIGEVGFSGGPGEWVLHSWPVVLRFWLWSHTDCVLTLTNDRLLFWDREDDARSWALWRKALHALDFRLKGDQDITLMLPGRGGYQVGMEAEARAQLVRALGQEVSIPGR